MTRPLLLVMMLSVCIAGCATTQFADLHNGNECDAHVLISPEQAIMCARADVPEVTGTFRATDRSFDYRFEISSKGNGVLEVGNLLLKVYDRHDDGHLFQPGLLCSRWINGINDQAIGFELFGTLITSIDRDGNNIAPNERGLSLRCVYNENEGRFVTAGDKELIVLSE